MKYPCLIHKSMCKTDIEVVIEQEGVDKYGEPLETFSWSGKYNFYYININ